MKRGEIWTVAGGPDYTSKPRPAVILQADQFGNLDSVTICLFTSEGARTPLMRIPVYPSRENGLLLPSWLMVDKIATVPRAKLGICIGSLDHDTLIELGRAVTRGLSRAAKERTPTRTS